MTVLRRLLLRWMRDSDGATAVTVALVIALMVAAAGIAVDYARLAGLDTELQQAADQAALAAAGQLDRRAPATVGSVSYGGAVARATSAATAWIRNQSRFATDGLGRNIGLGLTFFTSFTNDAGPSGVTTSDASANFVRATVTARRADFALTPIVGALANASVSATAVAGLSSAICNTTPVMICNPAEPFGNTDEYLAFDVIPGRGIRLLSGSPSAPGNFGFLETGFGTGASDLSRALGWDRPPGRCVRVEGAPTKPGLNASVMNAINTRFDVDRRGGMTCPGAGPCSPSVNVRKDLIHGTGNNNCGVEAGQGWEWIRELAYLPTSNAPLSSNVTPRVMGHPRDICHAGGSLWSCAGGPLGDGNWDRAAYFRANYGWTSQAQWTAQTGLPANATRYQVYLWEIANRTLLTQRDGANPRFPNPHQNKRTDSAPSCGVPGITPSATAVDRRRISVAVINCRATSLNGRETVPATAYIDVFIVEPVWNRVDINGVVRTTTDQLYVEVIGITGSGGPGAGAQVVRRDVPRLLE